jgi:hypothetical protein
MIGKCPDRGTILVKDGVNVATMMKGYGIEHRCPSCTKKFHRSSELEWEQEE